MADRPVIYLDVDGVILRHPDTPMFASRADMEAWWLANPGGGPPDGVREFLEWATAHCEVRWLTAWGACGDIGDEGRAMLARRLRVPVALLEPICNPLAWDWRHDGGGKCIGIDWDEHDAGRLWAWLDDDVISNEQDYLRDRGALDRFVHCNTSKNANDLLAAWDQCVKLFSIEKKAVSPPRTPPEEPT